MYIYIYIYINERGDYLVHFNYVFATTMQLLPKPIKVATMYVLVIHVIGVESLDNYICNYSMGESKDLS
jgi:hypothetical protein